MPPTATFVVGPRDTIEDVNDEACALVGYTKQELVGMHGSDLIPIDRRARTAVSLDRMRLRTVVERDGVLRHKNGTIVTVDVEARVLDGDRLALDVRSRRA